MDENGFRKFLKDRYKEATIRMYFERVRDFEGWLFKHQRKKDIEDANESDIRNWAANIQKKVPRCRPYFYGVKIYYRYKRDPRENLIIQLLSRLIPLPRTQRIPFHWIDFEMVMSKAEETSIKDEHRALLNLLWSEMKSEEIINLNISDIDFQNRLIVSPKSGNKFHVTPRTWDALEKYIPSEKRNRSERLFSIGLRNLQIITNKYFGSVGQTPNSLRKSCQSDFIETGKQERFRLTTQPDKISSPTVKLEPKTNLFDNLIQEIKNFGNRVHYRIGQIKDEAVFNRLLEGYLLAAFPDETITPEFHFRGIGIRESIIDFAIGRGQKIPIEVKLTEEKIRDDIGKGSGQVKEFLEHVVSASNKGILVVVDEKRDPDRLKLSRIEGSVHIVII
jgi:integrase